MLYYSLQGFKQAITLGATDTTDSKQGEAYYHLVDIVSSYPRRLEEALEICKTGLKFGNSFTQLYITYSNLLVLVNRTFDALSATQIAAQKNPSSSAAHYNLGLINMKLNRLPQAAEAFRIALTIQQDSVQVMFNLASILQVTANGHLDILQEALEL